MAKLKHIIKQLSEEDFDAIYHSLTSSNADKSAFLLKAMRSRNMSDNQILEVLQVNTNAYYTLRSRLNQKIEEHLLQQMESPRTDLLKKVSNINEMVFTKKKAISIATLKKLEKELLDYDLSNELTVVYKALKKLHINSPDFFHYSQLYNKHVSYMLAIDKIEDILADYFKKFSVFTLTGDEIEKLSLDYLKKEINNMCDLYDSHRPYVYKSCVNIFHRLFVMAEEQTEFDNGEEAIEDIFDRIDLIFEEYHKDAVYFHLKLVFEFLKLEYYNHYRVYRKAGSFYDEVNNSASALLSYCNIFTFPSQFMYTKISRHLRLETEAEMYEECSKIFEDYSPDMDDIPNYINYILYRSLSCYYADKYDEAARWINNLLNEMSLKKYPYAMLEIKAVLALQYCCMRDFELFNQLISSIQRQIRILGKENCEDVVLFVKMLKTGLSDVKRDKEIKVNSLSEKFLITPQPRNFSPIHFVRIDDKFKHVICRNDPYTEIKS
ncbi:hypothetical protein V6R21_22595 [Limibacter armeniacum]|uniref:hypothetical protein n=1 Tax=Limibacter armeniacum TaxID=466084 RepID=UPI002FE5B73A